MLGISPSETLVIEDSLHCIETAKKAGFCTAAVYDESAAPDREQLEETADYYIMRLDEIEELIK